MKKYHYEKNIKTCEILETNSTLVLFEKQICDTEDNTKFIEVV